MTKLSDRFRESAGAPVEWEGRQVHQMHELSVEVDEVMRLEFVAASPHRPQALRLKARDGHLEVNGRRLDDVVLWSDSSPSVVIANVHPHTGRAAVSVRVWNAWRDAAGSMHAWIGNAGMLVEQTPDEAIRLRCSDGFADPTFEDLVVLLDVAGR